MDTDSIDYASGDPPYLQLAAILRAQIAAGELTGRLPGEKTIAQTYGLAPGTVAKALGVLRGEGLIQTAKGWGSSVIPPGERQGS